MANDITSEPTEFERELAQLINKHSLENASDTPDFILALYLRNCLDNFAQVLTARDHWYNFSPWESSRK